MNAARRSLHLASSLRSAAPCILLFAVFAASAMITQINHDESQYVAASWLARSGLPYRDFAYLQTPLQPMLFAPLAWLAEERLLLVERLVNAALMTAGVWFVWQAMRTASVSKRSAIIAIGAMISTAPLIYVASVARNDALPFACFAAALWQLLVPPRPSRTMLVGLLIGLAAAAKISYVLPTAALLGLSIAGPADVRRRLPLKHLICGLAPPILFVAILALLAPAAFLFEVFRYAIDAPRQWYIQTGQAHRLTLIGRTEDFLRYGLDGTALVALMCVGTGAAALGLARLLGPRRTIVVAILAAGLLAAFLPTPMQRQYWLPALPPIFIALGYVLDQVGARRPCTILLPVFTFVGWAPTVQAAATDWKAGELPVFANERDARALDALIDEEQLAGPIATLRPELFTDTDHRLDPRFAAGPFLYRSERLTDRRDARAWKLFDRDDASWLRHSPPGAFIFDAPSALASGDAPLSRQLEQAATDAGFVQVASRGQLSLWLPRIRPMRSGCLSPTRCEK